MPEWIRSLRRSRPMWNTGSHSRRISRCRAFYWKSRCRRCPSKSQDCRWCSGPERRPPMPPFPAARGTGRIDRCDHVAAKHSRQIFKVHCITSNNLLSTLAIWFSSSCVTVFLLSLTLKFCGVWFILLANSDKLTPERTQRTRICSEVVIISLHTTIITVDIINRLIDNINCFFEKRGWQTR